LYYDERTFSRAGIERSPLQLNFQKYRRRNPAELPEALAGKLRSVVADQSPRSSEATEDPLPKSELQLGASGFP